jgi:transcriptional regulator with XRE-family HTH domain
LNIKRRFAKDYKEFCRRLKQARREAGLTQVEVATRLKLPQSFIANCESGERRVDIIELQCLAEVYRKPIQYFLP